MCAQRMQPASMYVLAMSATVYQASLEMAVRTAQVKHRTTSIGDITICRTLFCCSVSIILSLFYDVLKSPTKASL